MCVWLNRRHCLSRDLIIKLKGHIVLLHALHAAQFEDLSIAHDITEALGQLASDSSDNSNTVFPALFLVIIPACTSQSTGHILVGEGRDILLSHCAICREESLCCIGQHSLGTQSSQAAFWTATLSVTCKIYVEIALFIWRSSTDTGEPLLQGESHSCVLMSCPCTIEGARLHHHMCRRNVRQK